MKEIDLLSLSKTKSETKNSPSSKVEKKEAPSLFDSLLSEVKVEKKDKESTTKTESLTTKGKKEIVEDKKSNDNKSIELKDSSKKISIKNEEKNEEKSDKKVELKDSIKTETTKETIKVKNETSTSLLDKMVLEAKKNIKENNTETKKETVSKDKDIVPNTKTDIPTKETISNEAKTDKKDTTAVEKTKDKKEAVDLDKKDNKLTDNKKSTDLANSKNILNGTEQKKNIEIKTEKNIDTELLDTKNKKEIKTNTSIDKNNKLEKKDETEAIKDSKDDKTEKNKDINSTTSKDILKQENNSILEIDEKLSDNKVSKVENLIKNEEIKTEKKVELKSDVKESSSLLTPNSKKENKLDEKEVSKKEIKTEIKPEVDTSSNEKVKTSSNKNETESTKNVKPEIIDNKSQRISTDKKEEKQDNKIVEQKINDVKHELKKEEKQTSEKVISSSEDSLKTIDEKKDTPSSKISSQNLNTSADTKNVKNEKVAQELSKLNTNPLENKEASPISKDNIKSDVKDKTTLEKLLDQNKAMDKGDIVSSDKKTAEKVEPQITIKQDNKNEFLSNIYLSSQKNSMNNQSLAVKHEGVKTAKEAKNVDDIKKSAKLLNLEAKEVKVEVELSKDKDVQKTNFLNRVMLNKNSIQENIQMATLNSQNNTTTATTASGAVTSDSTVIPESEVNINVSATATMTIQNRIIGARQQMSSMMSDVARNMYENYKPPVTAFRINLLPAQLGSIAILMKNDRESGLNISLNISNSNTLDSFIDNESGLKSALAKNFGEDTEFNLDFNSGDGNNNPNEDEPKEQKRENISSTDLLNARNKTSKNPEQDTSNYM